MIKSAPWSFLIVTSIIIGLSWVGHEWLYKDRLERKQELIDYYKEKPFFTTKIPNATEVEIKQKWKEYKPTVITNKTFISEIVPLDAYEYYNCKFVRVTFEYNGDTPIRLHDNKITPPIVIKTKNFGIDAMIALFKEFDFIDPKLKVYKKGDPPISQ